MSAHEPQHDDERSLRLVLIDTCGDPATLALVNGSRVEREVSLPGRSASADLLPAFAASLDASGWTLDSVDGLAVVNGPGSFTGMRVGLAIAKGLCMATGKPLATVSRLAVLLSFASDGSDAVAALNAGRGEIYVRRGSADSAEEVIGLDTLDAYAGEASVLVAEASLFEQLRTRLQPERLRLVRLNAAVACSLAVRQMERGGASVAQADAHYVRKAQDIYRPATPYFDVKPIDTESIALKRETLSR